MALVAQGPACKDPISRPRTLATPAFSTAVPMLNSRTRSPRIDSTATLPASSTTTSSRLPLQPQPTMRPLSQTWEPSGLPLDAKVRITGRTLPPAATTTIWRSSRTTAIGPPNGAQHTLR